MSHALSTNLKAPQPPTLPEYPRSRAPGNYGDGDAYDRYMGRWSLLLARKFLDFARVETADSVLDVGSGTGSLTAAITASAGPARVVGLDPVASFVRAARARFSDPRVRFDHGDACDLPYSDASFDACLAQLSFHHFPDGHRALSEMVRVTRPGGVIAACEWDRGSGMEMFHALWETLAEVHPWPESWRHPRPFAGNGDLLALWRDVGLEDAEQARLVVPLRFDGFDDFWTAFVDGPSTVLKHREVLVPSSRDAFRRKLRERFLGGGPEGPFELQARAWAVRGQVPR